MRSKFDTPFIENINISNTESNRKTHIIPPEFKIASNKNITTKYIFCTIRLYNTRNK